MSEETRIAIEISRRERVSELGARLALLLNDTDDIVLEIGCGHGHFLSAFARENPNKICLGVDLLSKRIERAEKKRNRLALQNLAFFKADAKEFLEAVPLEKKIAEIFFLFPDPWPKQRHHKNRLIQFAMLERLAALSVPLKTRLNFRSDHAEYFAWTVALLNAHPAWKILPDAPWPFEQETMFSQRLPIYQSVIAERINKEED